ncbi:MAG TPA: hypothetical protein VGF13_01995, partial [Verrucomicrobiae bacterium]
MKRSSQAVGILFALCASFLTASAASDATNFLICVSNERGGTVTIVDGASERVVSTIPVGKRPRGIHASP